MKVYVLMYEHPYEYTTIIGVFSTTEKAEEERNKCHPDDLNNYTIIERELDCPDYSGQFH